MVLPPRFLLAGFLGFAFGSQRADAECTPGSTDCDLGGLFGIVWALVALAIWVGVVVAYELVRRHRSDHRPTA